MFVDVVQLIWKVWISRQIMRGSETWSGSPILGKKMTGRRPQITLNQLYILIRKLTVKCSKVCRSLSKIIAIGWQYRQTSTKITPPTVYQVIKIRTQTPQPQASPLLYYNQQVNSYSYSYQCCYKKKWRLMLSWLILKIFDKLVAVVSDLIQTAIKTSCQAPKKVTIEFCKVIRKRNQRGPPIHQKAKIQATFRSQMRNKER